MSSYAEFKAKELLDPAVKAEYDALEPEFAIVRALMDAQEEQNFTQQELSERTGISQADLCKIENGTRNPSLDMIKRLAKGLGMRVKLEFIPEPHKRNP